MAYLVPDNLMQAIRDLPKIINWIRNFSIIAGNGLKVQGGSYGDGARFTIALDKQIRPVLAQSGVFPVRLTSDGGSAGDKDTQCSFTYTVKDKSNTNTLGTAVAMTGNGQRVVNAVMTAGNYGMAYMDQDELKLIWADERISQTNCVT